MNKTIERVRIRIVNVRGLKTKLQTVGQMEEEVAVLWICETWLRVNDKDVILSLDGSTEAPRIQNSNRGHGDVGIIINPLLPYTIDSQHSEPAMQALSVKICSTMVTVVYLSPKAKWLDEARVFAKNQRQFGYKGYNHGRHERSHKAFGQGHKCTRTQNMEVGNKHSDGI